MASDHYLTIIKPSEGLFKDKGSKFISFASRVDSEEEIQKELEKIRKEFYDARHCCYAWILGPDQDKFRANDDGEPGHSAGDPILGQIRSRNLTNVLVVVVRYFGGIKLGISGLINAYKTAASEALNKSKQQHVTIMTNIRITYPYESTADILRIVDNYSIEIVNQVFGENCSMTAQVARSKQAEVFDKIGLLRRTGSNIKAEKF